MGAKGIENLPDNPVFLIVVQGLVGWHIGRDAHWKHDIAHLLAFGSAHHAADRLHHVDLTLARMQEENRIQRRHVHTLGETTSVAQDAALVSTSIVLEPVQEIPPLPRVVGAIHMTSIALKDARGMFFIRAARDVSFDDVAKFLAHHL